MDYSKETQSLIKAGQDPIKAAREHSSGKRAIGHILTDVPAELIHAAGLYPVQILSHTGQAGKGKEHFQSFTCSYGRGSLDILLDERTSFLEGVITSFVCDTTRCVDIVLRDTRPFKYIECFRPPKSLTGPGAHEYLIGELGRLRDSLAKYSGAEITDGALRKSFALYNKSRKLMRRIEPLRLSDPQAYFDICRAYTVLPVEKFIELAEKAVESDLPSPGGSKAGDGKVDIMLAGKLPEPRNLPAALKSMGARIVADDMAVGARLFAVDLDEKAEPIDAMADRMLEQIPYAGLLQPVEERPDFLVRRVKETGAKGIILLILKFCEIFELDAPETRERMQRENIPALILETDLADELPGTSRTRIEAFLEMINHG